MVTGDLPHQVKKFHDHYGTVVRVGPNELSLIEPTAWRDIYTKNFVRPHEYKDKPPGKSAENLISASEQDHARFRKILAPAFSEKSVHEQERVVQGHVDLLIEKLRQEVDKSHTDTGTDVDVLNWFNYTTFDIIGDFIWSSSFGCLNQLQYHPWIQVIAQFKTALIVGALKFYPPLDSLLEAITPKAAMADLWMIWRTTEDKISARLQCNDARADVMSHMIAASETSSELHMTREEIEINAMLMVIAGSESVTTVLTGITNYLLQEPHCLRSLSHEIRSSFGKEGDITGRATSHLPYLNAVLHEGLRLCPTIPDGMRRETPKGGAIIAGHSLPEGVVVSIPQWASYQSSKNFRSATLFIPERWLSESGETPSAYSTDSKEVFNPFSLGPHNCPGRSLAYLEMRLILARLVWNFQMDLPDSGSLPAWEKQKIYWFWEKQPTIVKFRKGGWSGAA